MTDYNNPNNHWQPMGLPPCDDENDFWRGCLTLICYVVAILTCLTVLVFCFGCKSVEYVFVPQKQTDTLMITQHQRDSIYLHDSTFVEAKGDTLRITKWRTKYVEKLVHDTIYKSKVDSIPYPVPQPVEVPAKLTWWQQTRLHLANILLYVLLGVGGWYLIKFIMKKNILP